jgi:hypothetical protein
MTAQSIKALPNLSQFPTDNPYNLYNLEAKPLFSQLSPLEFSQSNSANLTGSAPSERSEIRLFLRSEAVKGGEISC